MRTFACVVTYEPDLDVLDENLRALSEQVDAIVLVDNGSTNVSSLVSEMRVGVSVHQLPVNRGLSVAMNYAVRRAEERGADVVLMMDQDSVVMPGLVALLRQDLAQNVDLAMVAPRYVDRNLDPTLRQDDRGLERVSACITSGSLLRLADWNRVRGWDEGLFVDYVDFDFCLRVRMAGRAIAIDHRTVLQHSIGAARRIGRTVAWGHSASRLERMASDVLHYARKHRNSPAHLQVVPHSTLRALAVIARKALIVAVHEGAKGAKLRALLRGTIQGLRSPAL